MKQRVTAGFVILFLLSSLFSASAVDKTDEMFRPTSEPGLGYMGYTAFPAGAAVSNLSGLIGMETTGESVNALSFCEDVLDPKCSKSDFFQYAAFYPLCENSSDLDCIEAITATDGDGKELSVTNLTQFSDVKANQYKGSPSIGLPSGSSPTLFTVQDATHSFGNQYMAAVTSYGYIDKTRSEKAVMENGALAIFAVKTFDGNYQPQEMASTVSAYAGKRWRTGYGGNDTCNYSDGSKSAITGPIQSDVNFGLKVRYSAPIKGWFHGRVQEPEISYTAGTGNSKVLTVKAQSVQVPAMSIWKKREELTPDLTRFYDSLPKPLGGSGTGAGKLELQNGPASEWSLMRSNNVGYSEQDLKEFLAWIPLFGDKANLAPTVWTMNLMTNFNSGILGSTCEASSDQLTGMVSTNATHYLAGPPTFNAATGEIEYKVAGPHLLPNGDLSRGTYDLTLRTDFARCLYGFSGTAVRATVSIVSDNGTSVNAVSVVNEKNGWLNFAARGFTYSSPTIRVKLTDANPAPTATSTPSAKPVAAKKTTITCVKGKTTKKVTAVKPKCPSGFKKKG
jgi:hypothetical protein